MTSGINRSSYPLEGAFNLVLAAGRDEAVVLGGDHRRNRRSGGWVESAGLANPAAARTQVSSDVPYGGIGPCSASPAPLRSKAVTAHIDFELSPKTKAFMENLREWSAGELRPFARKADTLHAVPAGAREIYDGTRPFEGSPSAGTVRVPQLEGGEDGTYVVGTSVVENGCYGDGIFVALDQTGIGSKVVRLIGTPEQAARWGRIEGYTGFALTEPGSGSDAAALITSATRDGDQWILNGTKMFCSGGALAEYVVVFATVDRALGWDGIRAFVVPNDSPGFKLVKANEDKLGMRAMTTSLLSFEDLALPLEHCLGSPETQATATRTALATLNTTRHQVASMAIGMAQAALDEGTVLLRKSAAVYAPRRWAKIEEELAAMNFALDNGRLLVRRAAWMLDEGLPFSREASVAKAATPPLAEKIIGRIVRLLGPDGYSTEHLFEKWYRDVKLLDIWEGTGQVQRRSISRHLMGRSAAAA